ncbi:TonB family protein [Pseudoalteromonas sp. YIC-656]|uniref:energy transducer TonB n=1 Tax=Pseudoalteromonas pernae TaxID=3118054 RepID=UPI0032428386
MQMTMNHQSQWLKPSLKITLCLVAASVITIATFSFMVSLLNQPARTHDQELEDISVVIMEQPQDIKVIERERPVPPKPQERPQTRQEMPMEPGGETGIIPFDMPSIDTTARETFNFGQNGSGQAMPLVRVPPQYPAAAARDGIEGYVVLSYDISATGQVINAKVIDAEPKRTFDKDALRALKKWKFNPMVVDGVAKVQSNQQVRLDFNLQQ